MTAAAISPARGTNVIRRGDLLLFVSYLPDGDGYQANGMDSKQPALFIAHKASGVNKAWAIPLSEAWKYCNADGYPTTYAFKRATDIGNHIGLGDSLHVRRQIFTMLGDYLPSLLNAKEFDMVRIERHGPGRVFGEVAVVDQTSGRVIGGTEIRR